MIFICSSLSLSLTHKEMNCLLCQTKVVGQNQLCSVLLWVAIKGETRFTFFLALAQLRESACIFTVP